MSFKKFKKALGNAALVYLNTVPYPNRRVRACCPLGLRTDRPLPPPLEASSVWKIRSYQANAFIVGYEGRGVLEEGVEAQPEVHLG